MSGFKRVVLFLYAVVGLLCLAALALPWFGVFQPQVEQLSRLPWYSNVVQALLAVTAFGLVVTLLRSLVSRKVRAIEVMDIDGGLITVTRDAVASQASHIVEEDGLRSAKDVSVRARRRGPVDVLVKVRPFESVDITREAPVLHAELVEGLAAMCGDRLGEVGIEYLEPQRPSTIDPDDESAGVAPGSVDGASVAPPRAEAAAEEPSVSEGESGSASAPTVAPADATGDITIPMRAERED